jgi:uncharacterized OB-fold protein
VTFSIVYSASDQYVDMKPYVLAIVELEEGARMTTQIICEPEEVYIGMPVESVFRVLDREGLDGVIHYGTKFMPGTI